jgi:hypothetical protein
MLGQHGPCGLAQTAFGAVALNRPADLLGDKAILDDLLDALLFTIAVEGGRV